jgi:acyl transferase domain-containing protein
MNDGIAIVAAAGRFPGASSIDALFDALLEAREAAVEIDDIDLLDAGVPAERLGDPAYVKRRVFLDGIDDFDERLFGMTPRDAALRDPQHRLFLEIAWEALETAGYDPSRYRGKIGVFAGSSMSLHFLERVGPSMAAGAHGGAVLRAVVGSAPDYLATFASYKLDLRGPSMTVQTACSTSLVAVHLACQSLLAGESDIALAGGVSIQSLRREGYAFEEGSILSPDGRCRAFDAGANGTIPGSGAAVVVLKRLADAMEDGDTIVAVIRGSAMNNDGALKAGFSAPSENGQAAVVAEALAVAGFDASSIGYVEAHGTGTPLGDPIEIAALRRAFSGSHARCLVGSLKPNIGHLDAAAGVTGLVKAALAIARGEIPPTLHYEAPNPAIDFGPFEVVRERTPWPKGDTPRRAGVSSFGFGGTNVHVVLEEAPPRPRTIDSSKRPIVMLSAKTESALDALASRVADAIEASPDTPIADIAFTLAAGRRELPIRRAVTGESREEIVRALRSGEGADPADAIASAWLRGESVDLAAYYAGERRARVPLPTYPFERTTHRFE